MIYIQKYFKEIRESGHPFDQVNTSKYLSLSGEQLLADFLYKLTTRLPNPNIPLLKVPVALTLKASDREF